MSVSNAVRVFRNILYRMKHLYGFTVTLRKKDATPSFNVETGVQTSDDDDYVIKKVVEVSRHEIRDFEYDLSYIAAGKNFVYGSYFESNKKLVIFEQRQLRNDTDDGYYDIIVNDQVIIEGEIYRIADITRLKANMGYIAGLLHVTGDDTP